MKMKGEKSFVQIKNRRERERERERNANHLFDINMQLVDFDRIVPFSSKRSIF